ncbi:recombinase family protein [Paenibacillus filicis]|uniref:Recombinase family protein n=1 Tax=Paenibacillus gyeongsangnamensis TaxID=3388067 RepID=A0ABT4QLA8_9BACL|nr:recombinase family protein [Paenibacillus filicis]MCZ8517658.1 recombinase family protein [Paenibacillus filicis]
MEMVGYARVSTRDQKLDLQRDALKQHGCTKVFMEKESGGKSDRPELKNALAYLRRGDTLVVTKLDRLARSTFDLHWIAKQLEERGIHLVVLNNNIDTSSPAGKLLFTMLGAVAEFERDLINERTAEGRERAKAKGTHMGRKGQDEKQVKKALGLYAARAENGLSVNEISSMTGVPRSTIYAKVKEQAIT